jgi:hypothetical protein
MFLQQFELSVLVNGRPVKEYSHRGNTFIEGKEGSEFEILLRNNTAEEVLAVVSVDGKSVITGEDCSIDSSGGYVIPPLAHIKVPGWRLDNNSVAKFVYSKPENAYATQITEQLDEPINLGVIGCAFFKRLAAFNYSFLSTRGIGQGSHRDGTACEPRGWDFPCSPPNGIWYGTSDATTINASYSTNHVTLDSASSQIGTGFGKEQGHSVSETEFIRRSTPEAILTVYYDSREGLQAKGVPLTPVIAVVPQAFPASSNRNKGCKPPLNWSGRKTE